MDRLQSEQSIKINCINHPDDNILFIQINDIKQDKKLFYCNYCLNDEEEFNFKNYVNINVIGKADESQIVDKWPPLIDQSIHKKIKQFNQQKIDISNLTSRIVEFFENLKSEINQKIESVKKIMINNSESLFNESPNIQEKYKELSQLKKLQQILFDSNMETQKKEDKLREFIGELESQKQKNSQTLEQIIQQQQSNYYLIDFDIPNTIKSTILELIHQINIFSKDQNNFDSQNTMKQSLLSNFSNNLTILSQEPEKEVKQNKEIPQIKELMSVLNLKSNYLKQDFINDFEKYLIETYPLLNKIKFDTIFQENQKIKAFQEISDEALNSIVELIQKINELQKNGNLGEQTQKIKQKLSGLLRNRYQQEDLDKLCQNYPIFDLLIKLPQQIDILPQMQMIKTNFRQSQSGLQIVKNQQNNQISVSQNVERDWTNCVSDFILDENTNYVFRFQFVNHSQQQKFTMIGLVRDSQKNLSMGFNDYLSCRFKIDQNSFYNGNYGIEKKEKGDFSVLKQDQVIEMRVCIKDEILQILDYPNYNHIISLSDEHKEKLQQYRSLRLNISHCYKDLTLNIIYASKSK